MRLKRNVLHALRVILSSVRPTGEISPSVLIIAVTILLFCLTALSHSVELTKFQAEGDCYDLANQYLKQRNVAFIISDALKGKSCNWNFQGKTEVDFKDWCKRTGLLCGGNPFYVGFDSVWYNGEFMPHQKAIYLEIQKKDLENERNKQDSLASLSLVKDTLLDKQVTIEYLEIGKSTADKLGFEYSEWIGSAKFVQYTDLFSVSIQAKNMGDTTFVYRSYSSVYDSSLVVFWGGKRDRLTQSNVTSNGVVSNNYVTEKFGLEFSIDNMKYRYSHSTDYEHSISGEGKLHYGKNTIMGIYQYTYTQKSYLPVLGNIPVLGFLFSHYNDLTETRYILINVDLKGVGNV